MATMAFLMTLLLAPAGVFDVNADDYKLFEGSWRYESMEVGGKAQDISEFKDTPLVLKGKTWSQGEAKGTFKIDAAKKPKTIDLTFTEGPPKGLVLKGIYELDETTYKVCVANPGSDRPKVFDSKAKDGGSVQVLKRMKP
jgi:uncharacterized protein (TIGR03067 family)